MKLRRLDKICRAIKYGNDDSVKILDDDAPNPRVTYMELETKRPSCTVGCYNMTLYEFTSSKLTAEKYTAFPNAVSRYKNFEPSNQVGKTPPR